MYPSPPCVFDSEKGGGVRCDVNLNQLQFRFLRWRANGRSGAARNIFLIHNSPPLPRFPNFETRDKKKGKEMSHFVAVSQADAAVFLLSRSCIHTHPDLPCRFLRIFLKKNKTLLFLSESLLGRGLIPSHQKSPRVQKWRVEITKKKILTNFRMSCIRRKEPKLRWCCKKSPRLSNLIPD